MLINADEVQKILDEEIHDHGGLKNWYDRKRLGKLTKNIIQMFEAKNAIHMKYILKALGYHQIIGYEKNSTKPNSTTNKNYLTKEELSTKLYCEIEKCGGTKQWLEINCIKNYRANPDSILSQKTSIHGIILKVLGYKPVNVFQKISDEFNKNEDDDMIYTPKV